MREFASIRGKSKVMSIETGARDMEFPNTPEMPESYRGRIINVTFGDDGIYRTDTKESLEGPVRKYFLAEMRRHPLG